MGNAVYNLTSGVMREQFTRNPSRQNHENRPCSIFIVIGLGGTGSHVADILTTVPKTKLIITIDDDKVTLSNLNRTPYTYEHLNVLKNEAIADHISRKNVGIEVIGINKKIMLANHEEIVDSIIPTISSCLDSVNDFYPEHRIIIYDCRDEDFRDQKEIRKILEHKTSCSVLLYRPGYNGFSISLDPRSEDHPTWGTPGYHTISSHGIPARLVASLLVFMSINGVGDLDNAVHSTGRPITFNIEDILESMYVRDVTSSHLTGFWDQLLDYTAYYLRTMNQTEERALTTNSTTRKVQKLKVLRDILTKEIETLEPPEPEYEELQTVENLERV